MKKTRLFDFSVMAILAALIVFPFLTVISYNMLVYEKKIIFAFLLPLIVAGFGYILYFFVWKAPYVDKEGAHYKALLIPKDRLAIVSEYDVRFKEPVYYLRDTSIDYKGLNDKELSLKQIRVQATMANTRKLTEYSGNVLTPAKKIKRINRG